MVDVGTILEQALKLAAFVYKEINSDPGVDHGIRDRAKAAIAKFDSELDAQRASEQDRLDALLDK